MTFEGRRKDCFDLVRSQDSEDARGRVLGSTRLNESVFFNALNFTLDKVVDLGFGKVWDVLLQLTLVVVSRQQPENTRQPRSDSFPS
jgi:hypothetical protein